jgi:DNA-directed RNA polymerase specialized sigma24 family protein
VLRTDLTDHRSTDDATLVRAVADGDAIALAEAYHRTITAAHACARRLLASPVEIEALLRSVYSELWEEPPVDEALEGWVRGRCFALGTGYLRQRGLPSPSASLAAWTSGVDADSHDAAHDPLERMISELTDDQQAALVRAHDQGLRTAEQDDPDAGVALQHALLVLASPLTDDERHAAEMCTSGVALANWIFGLLPPHEAATVPGTAAEPTPCGRLAGVLRRARRRFEPLPPTPDLGHRVLAWVLSTSQVRGASDMRTSSLDTDLRVASADLDRGAADRSNGAPRSSLDMAVPPPQPAEAEQQPVTALHRDNNTSPPSWARPDSGQRRDADGGDNLPTPLRAPGGPPALTGSGAAPIAFGNTAPAITPDFVENDGDEELVRMPLRSRGGPGLAPTSGREHDPQDERPRGADTQAIRRTQEPSREEDTVPPPAALRPTAEDDTQPPASRVEAAPSPLEQSAPGPLGQSAPNPLEQSAPNPLGSSTRKPAGLDDDTAPSPLTAEDRHSSLAPGDMSAESPLRRPAPGSAPASRDSLIEETQPHAPLRRQTPTDDRTQPPPRARQADAAQAAHVGERDADVTAKTPVRRDDSDPDLADLFRVPGPEGDPERSRSTGANAANLTAPTLPAARRPTPPTSDHPAPPANRPAPPPADRGPATRPPVSAPVDDDRPSGGSSVLRWLVVLILIAAGAAVGIFLGQMLI